MTIQRHSGDNMIAYLCKDGSYYDNGEMHGDKIGARDDEANQLYLAMLEEEDDGLYIQDIMRGGIRNDDPRIPRNLSK